jgi:hypothetical protein
LITARDVAAALHLVQIAKAGAADPRFEIAVVAQDPAAAQFTRAGVPVRTVSWPAAKTADDAQAAILRHSARALLDEVNPAVVLSGLSTPFDASLDEAVLAEARVPTALYQDFWGEQNLILGRGADHILAIDEQAAERNQARFGDPGIVVGSARHAAYAELDILDARARMRNKIGTDAGAVIVGFFGQALHSLPGYRRTITEFISAALTIEAAFLLRPHPRETAEQRLETERLFAGSGLNVTVDSSPEVESALAACDVVVSLFSICTFDASYLNRFSTQPIAVPMSLLFDDEIAAYCRQHGSYIDFSHHTQGLVTPVYQAAALADTLRDAVTTEARRQAWARAHLYLPDPVQAPRRVLDAIAARVVGGGSAPTP